MAIRRFSTAEPGVKSNKFWDQDTQQGAMVPIVSQNITNAVVHGYASIPQVYKDLKLVISATPNADANLVIDNVSGGISFTGSTTHLYGTGSAIGSIRNTASAGFTALTNGGGGYFKSGVPMTLIVHFLDYTNTSRFKNVIIEGSSDANGSGFTWIAVGLIANVSAITGFNLSTQNGSIGLTGTSTLYGIKAGA